MVVEAHMKKLREIQLHKANALALTDFVRRLEDVRRLLTSIGCKYSSHLDNQDVTITLMRKLPDKGLKRKWIDRVPLKCPQCSGLHGVWRCWIFRSSSLRDHLKTVRQHSVAWRCISPWSFHRSPQRRREMDIFGNISRFPRILTKTNPPPQKRKPQLNAQKHWESKRKRLQLVSGSNTCKPSRHNSNLYDSRENHYKVEILNYSVSRSTENGTGISSQSISKFSFSQGVFHVLERYIRFEPWDFFPLTIKCYRKCLQNYKGTIFGVTWTEKYRFKIINAVTDEPKGIIFSNY